MANDHDKFRIGQYYHLEGLRNYHHDRLCKALQASKPASITLNNWVRIVDYDRSLEPLSVRGSLKRGGRFNIGADLDPGRFPVFPALYIAEDYETAYFEKFSTPVTTPTNELSGHEYALRKPASFTSININGSIDDLFDLTRAVNLTGFVNITKKFRMSKELENLARHLNMRRPWIITKASALKRGLLDKDWRLFPSQLPMPANPQVMGRLIMESGFHGILYPSVRGQKRCIAVFPENLVGTDSYLELADRHPEGVKYPRLDVDTWQELARIA